MVRMESKLNNKEIEMYKNGVSHKDIIWEVALRSDYHPLGYGIYGYHIYEKDGEYIAIWNRGSIAD